MACFRYRFAPMRVRRNQQPIIMLSLHSQNRAQTRRVAVALGVTLAASAVGLSATRVSAARGPDDPVLSLTANLESRTLTISVADSTVATYPVAIGKSSKPTPRGSFKIRKIVWNPAWIPPDEDWAKNKKPQPPGAKANPMKLVKIFFKEPDYYIHGTGDIESLGDAASHGCLRMDPDDAYRVARYLMDHGGSPRDENWFWRILHFRSETKTVYLDNPISIVVG
jgi:lipoprotein-anchoring transpeptidase ErfK/SrfK